APLEIADVLSQLLGEIALGLAGLHVGAVEPFHVVLIEGGGQRLDPSEEILDRVQVLVAIQDSRLHCGGVGVVRNRVPGREDQVLQLGEGHEFLDLGTPLLGALTEPDGPHLRKRSDRQPRAAPHVLDSRDERRGARTQPPTIQNDNAPRFPAPRNRVGAPSSSTRSARCAMPTLTLNPSPSARARVYDTSSEAVRATRHAATARVTRSGATPPRRKSIAIPENRAASPTRSSVES